MGVEIFNTTIGRIVEVPEAAVGAYLAQPAYRKVKAADRTPGAPEPVTPEPAPDAAPPIAPDTGQAAS